MIALVQRVSEANVRVDNRVVGRIGRGLLVLLGVHRDDTRSEADWLAGKVARMRIFPDESGAMNRSLMDIQGNALIVSQFTLYGNARKGNRPSFVNAAPPNHAQPLYSYYCETLSRLLNRTVAQGVFGAAMEVALVNDGPVTIQLERAPPLTENLPPR